MAKEEKLSNGPVFHLDSSEKREGIPDIGEEKSCGAISCPYPNFELGFGLAGGGFGPYLICHVCGEIRAKTVEKPEDQ